MDLGVTIGELTFKNPVIVGSAGYAEDENGLRRFIRRGYAGVVTKSTSKEKLVGAPPPRVFWYDKYEKKWLDGQEAHRNPGIRRMAENVKTCTDMARKNNCHIIGSISCGSIEEAVFVATEFEKAGASAIEIDMTCPHVGDHLGAEYGTRGFFWGNPKYPERAAELIKSVKAAIDIPLWPKMRPTTLFLIGETISKQTSPDAFPYNGSSFPNAPLGLAIDVETGRPIFSGNTLLKIRKGMKFTPYAIPFPLWPATILATALLKKKVNVPLVPSGGLTRGVDVLQAIIAGATAVEMCSAVYRDLDVVESVLREITWFMNKRGCTSIRELTGTALEHIPFDLIEIPIPPQ
jgi:dihydroorotate dehydrogenase (NAD+) catalytic subunit